MSGNKISVKTLNLDCDFKEIAAQLNSNGFNLHYWNSNNTSELDFVIHLNGDAIPVEVKSSDNVRSRSLKTYISKYNPKYSIKISL